MTATAQAAIVAAGTALAHYPTAAGATVDLSDLGPGMQWRYTTQCTGTNCPHQDGYRTADTAHRYAQAHAKKCYEQPAESSATHQFEAASYTQLEHGDRVKLPQMYAGHLTGWWWPVLTVDQVDWIRDDHTALMLRLTEPLPCGDPFVLIAGQAMVEAGVRRVTEAADRPAAQLPTTPDALADRILTAGDAGLIADLTAQIGGPTARRILAEAHDIVADRLWNS